MASFLLLGPLEIRIADTPVRLGGTRQRIVLAVLLLEAGKLIPTERLAHAVWDNSPPSTARAQIQISISKLRTFLARLGMPDAITTRHPGYQLRVPEDDVDAFWFRRLVAAGRRAARRQQLASAADRYREALELWRGEAVASLPSRLVQAAVLGLEEERLAATGEWVELELALGRHRDIIGELRRLVTTHPARERFHAQLMLALARDGRQAEALAAYQDARRMLVEEHGLDPSRSLQEVERAILAGQPAAACVRALDPMPGAPRQLPLRAKGFVGRSAVQHELRQAVAAADGAPLVVTGAAGVGKTTLAVEVGYGVSEQFPDGALFADMRRSDNQPVSPEQVLDYCLRALGVPPAAVPDEPRNLAGLYRSCLADLRVLIILDDAVSGRQVEPLLPGGPGTAVLVTSRSALPGLPNARRFELAALRPATSRRLLSQVVGADRLAAEPEAAASVAELCGHLPLALQIVAAKLATRPHWPIARMASRLSDEGRRLDELSLDGAGFRASVAVSLDALRPPARRLLLLLGSLSATHFASWVTGPLLDIDPHDGADVLDELVDARLAEIQVGTGHRARYRLHELVGVFARELLSAEVPAEERNAATRRLLRGWLYLADEAHRREYGGDFTVLRSATDRWPLPTDMVDELLKDPIRWFEAEHANLIAAVRLAGDLGHPDVCADLAVTAVTYYEARAHREDWRETHETALAAAVRHGDRRSEAAVRCSRAGLALVEQRFADAEADLSAALAYFQMVCDRHGQGLARRGLGSIERLQGRPAASRMLYRQALCDLRLSADPVGEAHVLLNLAQVEAGHRRHREAEQLLGRALAICDRVGVRRVTAQARYQLGQLHLERGDLTAAETEFTAVLRTVTTTADPVGQAYALMGLGAVRLSQRDLARAGPALAEAVARMRQAGSTVGEGRALLILAELCQHAGDPRAAAARLQEADAAFAAIGAAGWQEQVGRLRRQLPDAGSIADG